MLLKNDLSALITFVGFTWVTLLIYIRFGMASYSSKSGTFFLTESVKSDYYNNLAKSFTEGRLDVTNTRGDLDLIDFKDKHYLLWPPVPAIVLMPIVAVAVGNLTGFFIRLEKKICLIY
jgi:orotate phosphoribosyltransferase